MGGVATSHAPLVSVIIPTFNGSWCVAEAIEAVKQQSFQDFEAIVIDDGSTDGTPEVVRRAIAGDPRFRLITQANTGVAGARNRGIAVARGRYVAPLDSDDVWRPTFLEKLVAALQANHRAVMAFARSVWMNAEGEIPPQEPAPIPARVGYRELLIRNPIGNGSATLIRRDALVAVGGFDGGMTRKHGQAEDWWTQLQLSWRGEVIFVDEPLVLYRISQGSISHSSIDGMAQATRATIKLARRQGPRLAAHDYRVARSLAMIWQMRRARRAGRPGLMLRLGLDAYLSNPLWFLRRELRAPVIAALAWPFRALRRRRPDIWRRLLAGDAASGE